MTGRQDEELDWLAFRLASGDLTDPEAEAFLSRLAVDQAAREALARQARLVETLGQCAGELPATVVARNRRSLRVAAISVLATAASLALVVPLLRDGGWGPGIDPLESEVALAWASGAELADEPAHTSEAIDMEPSISDDSLAVPDWMLTLVSDEADPGDATLDEEHEIQRN